ncbi:hypothetical protein DV735_g4770, partial [Chaetothyriales sp. CBS 134920]
MTEHARRKRRRLAPPEPGPYVLRPVLDDIALAADESHGQVSITCVEFWDGNLYIGTSASEIIHLVVVPAADDDEADADSSPPSYILASRLRPSGYDSQHDALGRRGVRQLLVLPGPAKACVLCNGTVSFYSLPELTPAFQNPRRELTGVQWIGGLDENGERDDQEPVVMIAATRRILFVKVGEKLKPAGGNVEYPGCLRACRRDGIVCVADGTGYSLLDVEHQQKVSLFPISSSSTSPPPEPETGFPVPAPASSIGQQTTAPVHSRSTSLGDSLMGLPDRSQSPKPPSDESTPSRPRSSTESRLSAAHPPAPPARSASLLRPHVLSPFPTEFMLTTGTGQAEPGVGMFVNLDADVVRGTVEFSAYPESILIDDLSAAGHGPAGASAPAENSLEIVALLHRTTNGTHSLGIEIQQMPGTAPAAPDPAVWLPIPSTLGDGQSRGLAKIVDAQQHSFSSVIDLLQAVPVRVSKDGTLSHYTDAPHDPRTSSAVEQVEQEKALFDTDPASVSVDLLKKRRIEERSFVARFDKISTRLLLFNGSGLWQILPNPLLMQLEARLTAATHDDELARIEAKRLTQVLTEVRAREVSNELDFLTLNYIRQKASLLLFLHLQTILGSASELASQQSATESALHEAGLDPRVVLLLIPPLAGEVSQGAQGIWLHQGIVDAAENFKSPITAFTSAPVEFWIMIRHYLTLWQEKRGYASITDEKLVFDSVDAALLHTLLHLERALPAGSGVQASARAKLNNLIDHWRGEFEVAAGLLERHQRLYLLSRLYQSRKQAREVLRTWRRIVEGDVDMEYKADSGELELQIKRYLCNIRDGSLVQDYGIWLAQRNPDLGVQVFADDASKVKFDPQQVIGLLKQLAPDAVQRYLELLVFSKHLDQYSDHLVGYYLDSVLSVLESDKAARESLAQTYLTYRALGSPKPTYFNFIRDNAPPEGWWQSRLRLLELLGGSAGYAESTTTATTTTATSKKEVAYSVPEVLERLAPFSKYLVSESIILDARQGRHKEALRLLIHGLADYDTAVRYCYFGTPSPAAGTIDASELPPRELQEELFDFVLHEFLQIEDQEECIERTSQLLGNFATWFDPLKILLDIPADWSVATLSDFLLRSFRASTTKRNEAVIIKALSAAQNLQIQADFVAACEKIGATIEAETTAVAAPPRDDGDGDDDGGHAMYDHGLVVS